MSTGNSSSVNTSSSVNIDGVIDTRDSIEDSLSLQTWTGQASATAQNAKYSYVCLRNPINSGKLIVIDSITLATRDTTYSIAAIKLYEDSQNIYDGFVTGQAVPKRQTGTPATVAEFGYGHASNFSLSPENLHAQDIRNGELEMIWTPKNKVILDEGFSIYAIHSRANAWCNGNIEWREVEPQE